MSAELIWDGNGWGNLSNSWCFHEFNEKCWRQSFSTRSFLIVGGDERSDVFVCVNCGLYLCLIVMIVLEACCDIFISSGSFKMVECWDSWIFQYRDLNLTSLAIDRWMFLERTMLFWGFVSYELHLWSVFIALVFYVQNQVESALCTLQCKSEVNATHYSFHGYILLLLSLVLFNFIVSSIAIIVTYLKDTFGRGSNCL